VVQALSSAKMQHGKQGLGKEGCGPRKCRGPQLEFNRGMSAQCNGEQEHGQSVADSGASEWFARHAKQEEEGRAAGRGRRDSSHAAVNRGHTRACSRRPPFMQRASTAATAQSDWHDSGPDSEGCLGWPRRPPGSGLPGLNLSGPDHVEPQPRAQACQAQACQTLAGSAAAGAGPSGRVMKEPEGLPSNSSAELRPLASSPSVEPSAGAEQGHGRALVSQEPVQAVRAAISDARCSVAA